jgi:hypothetical protein
MPSHTQAFRIHPLWFRYSGLRRKHMSNPDTVTLNEVPPQIANWIENRPEIRTDKRTEPLPRLVGAPLPVGESGRPQFSVGNGLRAPLPAGEPLRTPVPIHEVARGEGARQEGAKTPIPINDGGRTAVAITDGVRAPLPEGDGASRPAVAAPPEPPPFKPVPAPEHSLAASSETHQALPAQPSADAHEFTGMQRAVRMLRSAAPYVQKILPLLDGNFATAVANILAPHPHPAPPPPQVNLEPLTQSVAELRTQQRDLRVQIVDQNSSLKRVEDQLEMVREATDRNTLEQQELIEDLKAVGNKVNMFAIIAFSLLAASVLVNIVLYLRLRHG